MRIAFAADREDRTDEDRVVHLIATYPCVGGAENFGRAMVRRFVEAGNEVDVLTSDAHDLWYFNDRNRKKLKARASRGSTAPGSRRFAVKHIPLQRYIRRLLELRPRTGRPAAGGPRTCRSSPGSTGSGGSTTPSSPSGFPIPSSLYAAYLTARGDRGALDP